MQETWAQFLAWEDPLEKGKATHVSILAWRMPWTEKTSGLQSMGSQSDMTELLTHTMFMDSKMQYCYINYPRNYY